MLVSWERAQELRAPLFNIFFPNLSKTNVMKYFPLLLVTYRLFSSVTDFTSHLIRPPHFNNVNFVFAEKRRDPPNGMCPGPYIHMNLLLMLTVLINLFLLLMFLLPFLIELCWNVHMHTLHLPQKSKHVLVLASSSMSRICTNTHPHCTWPRWE